MPFGKYPCIGFQSGQFAPALPDRDGCLDLIVAGFRLVALQLAEHPNSDTILIGGRISRNAKISTGGEVVSVLRDIRPDLCLIGTNSIDARIGITDSDWEVVDVKKAMIQASEKVGVLAISEKLDNAQKIRIAPINEIDYLITELDPGDPILNPYKLAGLQVI